MKDTPPPSSSKTFSESLLEKATVAARLTQKQAHRKKLEMVDLRQADYETGRKAYESNLAAEHFPDLRSEIATVRQQIESLRAATDAPTDSLADKAKAAASVAARTAKIEALALKLKGLLTDLGSKLRGSSTNEPALATEIASSQKIAEAIRNLDSEIQSLSSRTFPWARQPLLIVVVLITFGLAFVGYGWISKSLHKWKVQQQTQTILKEAEEQAKLNQARSQALIAEMQRKDAENKRIAEENQRRAQEQAERERLRVKKEKAAAEAKARAEAEETQRLAKEQEEREQKEAEQRKLAQQQEEERRVNIPQWKSDALKRVNEQLSAVAMDTLKTNFPGTFEINISPKAKSAISKVKILLKNQSELEEAIGNADLKKALSILNRSYDHPYVISNFDLDGQLSANGLGALEELTKDAIEKAGNDLFSARKPIISTEILKSLDAFTRVWSLEIIATGTTKIDVSELGRNEKLPRLAIIGVIRDKNPEDASPVIVTDCDMEAPGTTPESVIFSVHGSPLTKYEPCLVLSEIIRVYVPSPDGNPDGGWMRNVEDTNVAFNKLNEEYKNITELAKSQNRLGAISDKDAQETIVNAWNNFREKGRALWEQF